MIDYGTRTLFVKEVRRFLRVQSQTVFSPLVTTALYLLVFGHALGGKLRVVHGVPYMEYIVPGLVMLGVVTNAFLNSSSSMAVMKMQGTLVDLLVTPLGAVDITAAMVGAAAVRGLMVGGLTWLTALAAQGHVSVAHGFYALTVPVLAAIGMGAVGLLTGIWAEKIEQLNVIPTFIITPLTFLGGVFYDVRSLGEPFRTLSHFNPVLYLVEGFRYGLLGESAVEPWLSLLFLLVLDAVALGICLAVVKRGWRLRG